MKVSSITTIAGLLAASCIADMTPLYADDLDKDRWNQIAESEGPSHSKEVTVQSSGLEWHDSVYQSDEADGESDPGDPHDGRKTWISASPEVQMARDSQLPPVMTGGIFVPSMTQGMNEPKYQVHDSHGKLVKEAYTGSTAYVPPGDYTVVLGSLVSDERPEFDVHVVDGNVTLVPVEWSGLVVRVVNDRGTTIRGNYEIVRLPEREYVGLGSGALLNEGERLSTWLLWPGRYMIISAGEGYQARKNFITVKLEPGELSRVTLVIDEEDGDILGGGEVDEQHADDESRWWWAGLLVGGSVRFNRVDNVVGKATGQVLDLSGFLESYFTLGLYQHFLYTRLNAEIGGMIRFKDRPFLTTVDNLNFELLYTYRVVDWFGPYARFSFESNMAPAYQELTTPQTVIKLDDKEVEVSRTPDQMDIKLSPSFSPIRLNAGAGGRFDVAFGAWFKMSSRIGVAYRHLIIRDLYIVVDSDDDENTVTIAPVENTSQSGAEAALTLDLTPIQWFSLKVDASVLEPFKNWKKPIVDLDVDAAIRLTSIASLSYTLRLNYDVSLIDKVQIDQYVQLRFSYRVY